MQLTSKGDKHVVARAILGTWDVFQDGILSAT